MSVGQAARASLILASASSVRQRLLEAAGVTADVIPANVDEDEIKAAYINEGAKAAEAALALAEMKAIRIARRHAGALVIGADQILECEGTWFDKPRTMDEARANLIALRGRTHRLATAACVVRDGRRVWHHITEPALAMRDFSDGFLDAYLERCGDDLLSSVGAYRLEGPGAQLFAHIRGDFFTILGLPLLELLGFLREHGVVME